MQKDVIIVVRHGKPSLSKRVRLTWKGFRAWWKDYDASGLAPRQKIPARVSNYATEADIILSSPVRRALESARLAAEREPDIIDDDLIEAALPSPPLGPFKMGPKGWGTLSRLVWYMGWSDGMESRSAARARAEKMCDKLDVHAQNEKLVFVLAHGWFNRMLKGSLMKRGWKCVRQNGDLHWSHRRFERPSKFKQPNRKDKI